MTDAELVAMIAELAAMTGEDQDCSCMIAIGGPDAIDDITPPVSDCETCRGTGTVPMFPSLKLDCPKDVAYMPDDIYAGQVTCLKCNGVGWLPVEPDTVDLNRLLIEAIQLRGTFSEQTKLMFNLNNLETQGWWVDMFGQIQHSVEDGRFYATPTEAVIAAIYEAVNHA